MRLASLTKSNCWRGCPFRAELFFRGVHLEKFRTLKLAVASCFTGRVARPRYCVTSTADSRKTMAKGVLSSRRRSGRARGQPRATAGQNLCTGLHRFRGEFGLHKVCTATFLAHDLHTVFFPPLPKNAQIMLANIEYACYCLGNECIKRSKRGKW